MVRGWIYSSVCRIFFGRIECHLIYFRYIYRCTVHDLNQISNFWIAHKPHKLESYPGPHELIFNALSIALKLRLLSFKHVKRSFGMEPENYSRHQVLGTVFRQRQVLGGGGGRGEVTCSTLGCSLRWMQQDTVISRTYVSWSDIARPSNLMPILPWSCPYRQRFAAASLPRLCGTKVAGHTTRAPPVGFKLETKGIQLYAIANLDKLA